MATKLWLGISLLLVLGLPAHPVAAQGQNPHLTRGIKLVDEARDELALKALKRALTWKRGRPAAEQARVHLYLAITYFNLLNRKSAGSHLRQAFKLDPAVAIPSPLAPKLMEFIEAIRGKPAPQPTPVAQPVPQPEPTPPEPPPVAPSRVEPPPRPTPPRPATDLPTESSHWGRYWPAWTTLVLAAAAGGTGLALGLLGRSKADEANDLSLPDAKARPLRDTAESMVLSANILFGVAGAAAIASGILFYVGHRKGAAPVANIAPLRGGAMVVIRPIRW